MSSTYLPPKVLIGVFLVTLLLGIFLRTYDLERDPPMDIGLSSEDLTTDPHHLTSFAAQKVTFGECEPFPYPKWQVFKVSLPSALALALFTIAGPSRAVANLTGSLLATAGLFLLFLGLYVDKKRFSLIGMVAASLFVCCNFLLVTYQRMPFMETALFFYSGLIFFLLQKFRFKLWNILIISVLIALACLTGKMIGLALVPAVFLTILIAAESDRKKLTGVFLAGFSVSTLLLMLILFGSRLPDYLFYLQEQTLVSHGQLYIYEGILRLVARIVSYGSSVHFFGDSPMLLFALYAALAGIFIHLFGGWRIMRRDIPLVFGVLLLLSLLVLLMPVNYRPLRYATTLFFPLALVLYSLFRLPDEIPQRVTPLAYIVIGLPLALVTWYTATHVVVDFFYKDTYKDVLWPMAIMAIAPALVIATVLLLPFVRRKIIEHWPTIGHVVLIAGVISVILQVSAYVDWQHKAVYALRDSSRDLEQIVGKRAVITGPYAPTLTIGTKIKSFIYSFGLAPPDFDIFTRFNITHVAVDRASIEAASRDFSEMRYSTPITEYFMRNTIVRIQGIRSIMFAGPDTYSPTDYERAAVFFADKMYDSSWYYNERFLAENPDNRSALLQKLYLTAARHELDPLLKLLTELPRKFPDDFAIQITCALNLKRHGMRWNRPDLLNEAYPILKRAMELDYPNSDRVMRDFERFQ